MARGNAPNTARRTVKGKPYPVVSKPGAGLPKTEEERKALAARVLDRYRHGESVYYIAEELGCSNQSLYALMLKHYGDDWRTAASNRALQELEQAERNLDLASENVEVMKAQAQVRAAQWKLERLLKNYFGTDRGDGGTTVVVNVAPLRERVEDARVIDPDE